jgi:hypothetical protein
VWRSILRKTAALLKISHRVHSLTTTYLLILFRRLSFKRLRLLSEILADIEDNANKILLHKRRQNDQERDSTLDIQKYRGIYRTHLTLRILLSITCIAIIVVLTDSIRSYNKTKHVTNPFRNRSRRFPV